MKSRLILIAPLAMILLSGCFSVIGGNHSVSNGNDSDATVKKEIKIGDFNEIVASQSIKIIFEQGENPGKAFVATTPSAEKYLKVDLNGSKLQIYYDVKQDDSSVKIKGPSIVKVSSPTLTDINLYSGAEMKVNGDFIGSESLNVSVSSGAEFKAKGDFECKEKLNLRLSSAASFEAGSISCAKLKIDISSGADVDVKNLIGNLAVNASSGSDVDIEAANSQTISLGASSGSDINIENINAEEIYAQASSGADISLKGKTNKLKQNASSGGSVKTRGLSVN